MAECYTITRCHWRYGLIFADNLLYIDVYIGTFRKGNASISNSGYRVEYKKKAFHLMMCYILTLN